MDTPGQTPHPKASAIDSMDPFLKSLFHLLSAQQDAVSGMSRYTFDFLTSLAISMLYFQKAETAHPAKEGFSDQLGAYMDLFYLNTDLAGRAGHSAVASVIEYARTEAGAFTDAVSAAWIKGDLSEMVRFWERQHRLMHLIRTVYPEAIEAIEPEFGFHFEKGIHPLAAETDRFLLYQVMPSDPAVSIRQDAKPILILPPYVLGANILAFLPGENRSYAHAFANRGIPTYIRILKNIAVTEPLQTMTGEDDARDTRFFCETIMPRHGKPVTLNGYCQGGFSAVCNLLTGELDGLVDALITCVSPMDGTRSTGLSGFLESLPPRFNNLLYGTKILKNGNAVADGRLMGWVYKIKSIEQESPVAVFYRDLSMFARQGGKAPVIGKSAAALNYWLSHERFDLPMEITRMSHVSFNTPITGDGTLPVRLFGKKLNLHRLKEKSIPWLLCYGERDDLVEKETALAPLDFIPVETSPFPKGHVAIATSWSDPRSACALHTRFGEGKHRGPVRFQLDLDEQMDQARNTGAAVETIDS